MAGPSGGSPPEGPFSGARRAPRLGPKPAFVAAARSRLVQRTKANLMKKIMVAALAGPGLAGCKGEEKAGDKPGPPPRGGTAPAAPPRRAGLTHETPGDP